MCPEIFGTYAEVLLAVELREGFFRLRRLVVVALQATGEGGEGGWRDEYGGREGYG